MKLLHRPELFVITVIFLMLALFISLGTSTTQLTFTLDSNNPVFTFEERLFNDSSTYKNLIFSGNENKTTGIKIPKNSTILFSNITLKGESTPTQTYATDYVYSIAVGNAITSTPDNEIAVGTFVGVDLLNSTGSNLWNTDFGKQVDGVDIGNITADEGDEIVVASKDKHVYVLKASDGSKIWNYTGTNYYNDVAIGNVIASNPENEIVAGDADKNVTLLDSNGGVIWNFNNGDGSINSVATGDITADEGNEVVAGDNQRHLYLINSTGQLILGHTFGGSPGANILAVAVGDVDLSISGDEIAAAGDDSKLYLLDNQLDIVWSKQVGNSVESVAIGDVTSDSGNEIVIGSSDNKVYVFNSTGDLILNYATSKSVQGVAIGNITADPGNEVMAGSLDGHVYILNFEYYPTNVYLDMGDDGDKDWQHSSSKLRDLVSITGSSINSEIQSYLDNTCASQVCDVPLVFHSDAGGDLNVSSINITYDYDAKEAISSAGLMNAWSRTNNTEVNESIGNQTKQISYNANPANNIEIKYVKIDNSATLCDFSGEKYSTGNLNGQTVCNLSSDVFTINKIGILPSPSFLWDNSMSSGMPIIGSETLPVTTPEGKWMKNYTIWNDTTTIFYNVTANISIGSEVTSNEGLFVEWYSNGIFYDITPSSTCPNYESKLVGTDDFFICRKDTDGNGVANYFMLRQPHTSTILYTINGSIDSLPVLNNTNVTPSSDIWGGNFTFYVDVSDKEGDDVTVYLWVYHAFSGIWERTVNKNTTTNTSQVPETLSFEITSDNSWVGDSEYMFEYQDFEGSIYNHPLVNTTIFTGPTVTKHDVSTFLIEGNNTSVNRTGSDAAGLTVVITDTEINQNVSNGVNCSFWITKDRVNFTLANSTTTNSSGFCTFLFDPNESYLTGRQWWKAGTFQDPYYNNNNSTNYVVNILSGLGINLTNSVWGRNFTRGQDSVLIARLIDENSNDVAELGYTCTWYINSVQVGTSTTNDLGRCNNTWSTDCSSSLGTYPINVTLSEIPSDYYTIIKNESSTNVFLKGTLNVTILSPKDAYVIYERQNITLNSTVVDDCNTQNSYTYNVTWYSPQKETIPGSWTRCPYSTTKIAEGVNAVWTLDEECTPRCSQVIIANTTGNLYNPNQKNVSVYIFGFSITGFISPVDNSTLLRNGTYDSAEGLVDVSCKVRSNASSNEVFPGYPVNFWDGDKLIGTDNTNTSGIAEVTWDIDQDEVSEGYHSLKCNVSEFFNCGALPYSFNVSVKEANSTVKVLGALDRYPPIFLGVYANSVERYKEIVTIEANVTDWFAVDKVWVTVTFPDRTNHTYNMNNVFSNTWRYSENFTELGDYDFIVYANDTTGNENNTLSWFELYLPLKLTGSITNWNGEKNITSRLNFYRNGTNYLIHQVNTNSSHSYYNLTIHKRLYDVEVKVFDHTILFHNVNTTDTAIKQFNTTDVTNITNPLNFTDIDVTWIRPARYITRLAAFDINSIFMNSLTTITMNYSSSIDKPQYKPSVRISRCQSWSNINRNCTNWDEPTGTPSLDYDIVSINVTSLSAYAAIEAAECGDHWCHVGERCGETYFCEADCGQCPAGQPSSPSGSSGSGGPSSSKVICGNNVCEVGENPQNCPKDCGSSETVFSIRTNLTEPQLNPGDEEMYAIWVTNNVNYPINVSLSVTGSISKFIGLEKDFLMIDSKKEEINKIYAILPSNADIGTYTGHIVVSGEGKTVNLPVTLTVSIKSATILDVLVESRNKVVGINETAMFRVMLYNYGLWKKLNLSMAYFIENSETKDIVYQENEILEITQSKTLDKRIKLSGMNISVGRYLFNVTVNYDNKVASAYDDFEITEAFWTTNRIRQAIIIIVGISIPTTLYFIRKRYIGWKLSKARYIFPVDFRKLPTGEVWLGKIAETNNKAYFNMNELKTHVLTAGATGSGKSVSAMIFVEELLKEKIPIIVFDPTAQWSGFVRPCRDPNLLKYYTEFGMDKRDTRPYNGMIYEVTDPNVKIDFDKYMNPGEITVFMLHKLKPGQYDDAVKNIIDTIFAHGWEESTKLRMIVVFDEVHRLLEKYGGKGGYVSLERACREFRKWGIGLIMASQVLSDFKEAIKGNVLTEIQLHTKSLGDLGRIEKKYGLDYTKRVTRLEVGVGMIQNPKYNEGRPWFIAFRPTFHEPHKIPDRDLETYKEYAAILARIEAKIEEMERTGKDVFDLRTEFKLAQDKLKKGRFRMAKIYIDSLRKHLLGE